LESLCAHKDHVPEWTLIILRPKNPLEVKEMIYDNDKEIEDGIGGKWIVDNLHPSDNIGMPTLTNKSFWLIMVDKGVHTIFESFEDVNMNEWTIGDVVVKGYWYEILQPYYDPFCILFIWAIQKNVFSLSLNGIMSISLGFHSHLACITPMFHVNSCKLWIC
jgi:hypothetical protein